MDIVHYLDYAGHISLIVMFDVGMVSFGRLNVWII
jgi:hypothetical protein